MRKGWEVKKIGEVCTVIAGQSPEGKYYNDDNKGLPFYQGKKEFGEKFIKEPRMWTTEVTKEAVKNDILMSVRAPVGPINYSTERICIGRGLAAIRAGNKILNEFLYYNLLSKQDEITGNVGAVFSSINKNDIENLLVALPPLSEQKQIVSILDEAFEGIAKAKANAEKNLANVREIFEAYLQDVFSNQLNCVENKMLCDVAEVFGGGAFKSHDFKKEGKYQVLRMGNVRPGKIRPEVNPVYLSDIKNDILPKVLLKKNDVIITQTGTRKKRDYGFTAVIEKSHYLLNQRIAAIRFSECVSYKYFLYFSWSNLFKNQFFANETGTVGQGNVGIDAVRNAVLPVPSLNVQKTIIDKLDFLFENIEKLQNIYNQKLMCLEELKHSLLEKAFNGDLIRRAS